MILALAVKTLVRLGFLSNTFFSTAFRSHGIEVDSYSHECKPIDTV